MITLKDGYITADTTKPFEGVFYIGTTTRGG